MSNPQPFDEPFAGGYRHSDPETSVEAALRDLSRKATDRVLALEVHYANPKGLTDFELGDKMGRQQTSAGKRRGELRDFGLIERSDVRRLAPSGSPAIVWVITERGRLVHDEIVCPRKSKPAFEAASDGQMRMF